MIVVDDDVDVAWWCRIGIVDGVVAEGVAMKR